MLSQKYLFLDDHHLQENRCSVRTFHPLQKEEGNPILHKSAKWEGIGPYRFYPVEREGGYGAWYGTYGGAGSDYPMGLMLSDDRMNWQPERFLADTVHKEGCQCCEPFYDESGNYPGYPYLGVQIYRETPEMPVMHARFRRSRDGVVWEKFDADPWWHFPSDVISVYWDPITKKYLAYFKVWKLCGTTVGGEPFTGYFASFKNQADRESNTFRAQGVTVFPQKEKVDVTLRFRGGTHNDGGGGLVDTDMTMIRVVGRAESGDFLHWENERIILEPPAGAPLGDQSYGMFVQTYAGMYIARYQHFNAVNGHIQTRLAWSYDSVHFTVRDDAFLLPCGEPGSWDAGMVFPGDFYFNLNGRLCAYYGAISTDHTVRDKRNTTGCIGRAYLRVDGFGSLRGGSVVTKPLPASGGPLSFNMRGRLELTVRDGGGQELGRETLRGDHFDVRPLFDPRAYAGQTLTLELDLSESELFSLTL